MVVVHNNKRRSEIEIQVAADKVSELSENFRIRLIEIDGGAEIDTVFNTSMFQIRCLDIVMIRYIE